MRIRHYSPADVEPVIRLFTESVHTLTATHYDEVQRRAWAPEPPDRAEWAQRLARRRTLVALDNSGSICGFIAFEDNGHIDLLYTQPAYSRRGVASALHAHAESALAGIDLFTEASIVSKPFFLRQGYRVVGEQIVPFHGALFRRFLMRKGGVAQQQVPADGLAAASLRPEGV